MPSPVRLLPKDENQLPHHQKEGLTLLFISRLEFVKGMEILPEIMPTLINDNRVKKIMILDFGLQKQKIMVPNHPKVEKLAPMKKMDYLQKIKSCDIAIGQLSPYGGIGVSELDAMNCSKPLVCRFIFDDFYTTPPPFHRVEDASSLINQIQKLLSLTSKQRYEYGKKNHTWVEKNHSQEVVYHKFITYLTDPQTESD